MRFFSSGKDVLVDKLCYYFIEHRGGGAYQKWPTDSKYTIMHPEKGQYEIETTITDLELSNGIKYSLEVIAINGATYGSLQNSHGIIVDITQPVVSKVSNI